MTFKQQADIFMTQIQSRRRSPARVSTVRSYRSFLDKWLLPRFGETELSQIENGTAKTVVQKLSEAGLSAASINSIVNVLKQIVASAVDQNGNQLYPRTWNNEFIDLPVVAKADQDAPTVTPKAIQEALRAAKGQDKALYALLAGTGLRVGEALALMVGPDDGRNSFWSSEDATIRIRTTLSQGRIQSSPKTLAGIRVIDLAPELNLYLCKLLLDGELPSQGLLFHNQTGGPVRFNTVRDHLQDAGIDTGFHAFRRFRMTHLDTAGVPAGLARFWAGHSSKDVHDTYVKSGQDIEARKLWAQKAGLGFQLEAR